MQVSAEIRWFWSSLPAEVEQWFRKPDETGCPPGGGGIRVDEYLCDPGQNELGIKKRGGRNLVEVKGLVARLEPGLDAGPFRGPIEIWSKWATERLTLEPGKTIQVSKRRWVRRYDTTRTTPTEVTLDEREWPINGVQPARGCNIELTEVTLAAGETWWTLGLESFGGLESVTHDLRLAASFLAANATFPLESGRLASYPLWLTQHILPK